MCSGTYKTTCYNLSRGRRSSDMSGALEKETFQRLTLLYLIGRVPNGIYSSFRLQKVLYYATRDVDPKPFTFHHTNYGQYSHGAAAQLTLMLEGELVTQKSLPGNREGSHWQLSNMIDTDVIYRSLEHGFPNLAQAVKKSVKDYGFQKQRDLDVRGVSRPPRFSVGRKSIRFHIAGRMLIQASLVRA